jgi:hypothetical protein
VQRDCADAGQGEQAIEGAQVRQVMAVSGSQVDSVDAAGGEGGCAGAALDEAGHGGGGHIT